MANRERRLKRSNAAFESAELFGNWELAKELADEGKHGIVIKQIDKSLNVPPQYLSKQGLRTVVHKHLRSSLKRYVPEYGGIYIAFNTNVQRTPKELNLLRCRQISPFLAQQQLVIDLTIEVAVFTANIYNDQLRLKDQIVNATVKSFTTDSSQPAPATSNLSVLQQTFKYLLTCHIANTFHVVVRSNQKFGVDEHIRIVISGKGISDSDSTPCLYAIEYKTFKSALSANPLDSDRLSEVQFSDTDSIHSFMSSSTQDTPRKKKIRFSDEVSAGVESSALSKSDNVKIEAS